MPESQTASDRPPAGPPRPQRPLAIWFITIYLGLFAGLFPAGLALFLALSQDAQSASGFGALDFLFALILGLVVMVTAFGTWKGDNRARIAFLIAITIHYTFLIYQNYQLTRLASQGWLEGSVELKAWGRVVRGLLWIALSWWYLTRGRVKAFCTAHETSVR